MSGLLELGPSRLRIENLYEDLVFPEGRNGRPYVAINVVTTVDGKATIGGRSHRVGSEMDHHLMRRIRAAADMVLIGAGTLRGENVDFRLPAYLRQKRASEGKNPTPIAAVLSSSGDLPLDRTFFQSEEFRSIVLVTKAADRRRVEALKKHADVLVVGEKTVEMGVLLRVLERDLGVKRLLVEGGPGVNHAFIAAGLVDELFLTLSPKVTAGRELSAVEGARLPGDGEIRLGLISGYAHEDELYLRYRFLTKA